MRLEMIRFFCKDIFSHTKTIFSMTPIYPKYHLIISQPFACKHYLSTEYVKRPVDYLSQHPLLFIKFVLSQVFLVPQYISRSTLLTFTMSHLISKTSWNYYRSSEMDAFECSKFSCSFSTVTKHRIETNVSMTHNERLAHEYGCNKNKWTAKKIMRNVFNFVLRRISGHTKRVRVHR